MRHFAYSRPATFDEACHNAGHTRFLAGGTNLIDLMKSDVERPAHVIDIGSLPMHHIEDQPDGGLRLGALVTNADTAAHPLVVERYPLLASAILAGASPQIRNMATNGGNLNQRTRCHYFYDPAMACNKRSPGTGCAARGGRNRIMAVLGTSDACIATFPSDMCIALAALNATVNLHGPDGERTVGVRDYHCLPGETPWRDNILQPGEIVTAIDLPPAPFGPHHTYLKVRDRLSFAFAIVSVAVGLCMKDGRIGRGSIALGGMGTKPWCVPEAEALLDDRPPSHSLFRDVAGRLLHGATADRDNAAKIRLAPRVIERALWQAVSGTPQSQTDKTIR
ncbi:FAD-binding molybdopterin dehydrogenase [Komagataeibacter nataicola]|uniref:FAD-binding molybdopterin dehydrogenase n=1 Tax=Komagataeibacter nataicola TaxID=265960 RepID=A0A9N7H184_9PROT|nr:xanthine dehydrogenase family protein subunit M [Komagataeibacter nataicola]AQU87512.1 FAD-binding molybdopterin dehydrogenase [Komagataeibacter nataicola]PYD65436.1 FAD-binding molybdopterin dehydrogenase [Komagataeibacter nataicola]WEQ55254.1 xanthine dehydrogenase family protein subunit M [Komagataeibacter nataicola]WNM09864.1 xanthine dehydrogenase family protein subunit M [Komagataeibacter nataicola]GBR21614.1 oxidoreductase [Komagataeibacter nataicola NRIC 0616]